MNLVAEIEAKGFNRGVRSVLAFVLDGARKLGEIAESDDDRAQVKVLEALADVLPMLLLPQDSDDLYLRLK